MKMNFNIGNVKHNLCMSIVEHISVFNEFPFSLFMTKEVMSCLPTVRDFNTDRLYNIIEVHSAYLGDDNLFHFDFLVRDACGDKDDYTASMSENDLELKTIKDLHKAVYFSLFPFNTFSDYDEFVAPYLK